jgi:hypothetical protein
MVWWSHSGDFDWGIAASWAQVAMGFSFAGAGVVALLGVAHDLRTRRPVLLLHAFEFDRTEGLTRRGFEVQNYGEERAYGLRVRIFIDIPPDETWQLSAFANSREWTFRKYRRKSLAPLPFAPYLIFKARLIQPFVKRSASQLYAELYLRSPLPSESRVVVVEILETGNLQARITGTVDATNIQGGPGDDSVLTGTVAPCSQAQPLLKHASQPEEESARPVG